LSLIGYYFLTIASQEETSMHISLNKRKRDAIAGYLFILPTFVGVMTFSIIPIFLSILLSFTDWNFAGKPNFVGLSNYVREFSSDVFRKSLVNTVYYTILSVPGQIIVSLIVALALNKLIKGKTFFRTVCFMPVITSTVAISMVWTWIYDEKFGVINAILKLFNIKGPAWLINEKLVLPSLAIIGIWRRFGYQMVLFLAGLQSISRHYYEAADIDGASSFAKFWYITLPLLTPTMFFACITAIMNSFRVFDLAFIMTGGGPDYASHTLVLEVYRLAFQFMKVGPANAVATIMFIFILVITVIQLKLQEKWVFYEGD